MRPQLYLPLLAMLSAVQAGAVVEFPSVTQPGKAKVSLTEKQASLSNDLFTATFGKTADGVVFKGMKTADGKSLVRGGTDIFEVRLADGKQYRSADMKMSNLKSVNFKADENAVQLAAREPGKALTATFTAPDGSFRIKWRAILHDGSHYLRQEFSVIAVKDVAFHSLTPLLYDVAGQTPTISGNTTRGHVVANDVLFMGLETPMSIMTVGNKGAEEEAAWTPEGWVAGSFGDTFAVPESVEKKMGDAFKDKKGPVVANLKVAEGPVRFDESGACKLTFRYTKGSHKLNLVGVQLLKEGGQVVSEDIHVGTTGDSHQNNTYELSVPAAGTYTLRYLADARQEAITSQGSIEFSLKPGKAEKAETGKKAGENLVRGTWSRKTTLNAALKWDVSSVIGLLVPGQQRRSFLAYSERERAVPYRAFVHYNDWYEVGIRLHDNKDPLKRTTEPISLEIIRKWNEEMYTKRKTRMDAFILDDGWDDFNSLWGFHAGFPNGFRNIADEAAKQKASIGTWLGPVGGYGSSKQQRLNYWNEAHPNDRISSFRLSDHEYFRAFTGRCKQMVKDYGMSYFKFDGISTAFHAKGPMEEEDAEGIISVLETLRGVKKDLFINTTVGSWASPFWYHYTDCLWRQENDFGQVGNMGDARDKWLSYRDRLVYEVFVQGAPFCPLNSIMVHGTIITKNGPPHVMSREPKNCVKEMRCSFGSGSALQEVYVDRDLMDQENGRLWDELAECIKWVRRNENVLADVHWVGGNPWDGKDGDIYGWAAWNAKKCTLTLRNSSDKAKTMKTTLRKLFDIPAHVKGSIRLKSSFADQRNLPGLMDTAVDVDAAVSITLEPMEVIVMEGKPAK